MTSFSRSLFENSTVGFLLGSPLLITDPEDAINAGLLVDIASGNDLNVFSISSSGQLIVSNTLNLVYETTQSFTLIVRVKDSGKPESSQSALEKTTSVNVAVLPVNFPPTITSDTFTISENSASGSTVMKGVSAGSAATTSADRNTLTPAFYLGANPYSILSQETTIASRTGSGGQSPFTINTATGVLSVNGAVNLDFETKSSYKVIVQVIDNGGLKANATFTILLTNVNEAPYWLSVPWLYVPATAQAPSIAISPYAVDLDANDALTYTMSASLPYGNPSNTFAINRTTGLIYVINTSAFITAYNIVTGGLNYSLSISVCDTGIDGLSMCSSVVVSISAVAGSIPPVVSPLSPAFVPENALSGRSISRVIAYDEAGYTLSYTIVSGNIDSAFHLNISTGWLTIAQGGILNFATRRTYSLVLSVANVMASTSISLTINIVEVNKAPSLPDVQSFSIDENSNSGTVICTAVGTDPNSADVGKLTYTIVSVSPSPPFTFFTLNRLTGVLSVASGALLNFETTPTYTVTIRVTDSAWDTVNVLGALTDDGQFVVSLNNMNDAPTIDDRRISVRENEAGVVVGSPISASDQDTAQGFIFSLSKTSLVCQAQTITTTQVNTPVFFSLSLPSTAFSNLYRIYARIQKLSVGSVATLVIGSSASSDRYEIRMNASSTQVHRCSTSCTLLLSSSSVFVISSTPSTSTPLSNFEIEFDPSLKRVKVSSYSDGSYSSLIATMTAQDTLSMPTGSPLKVGVISSSSNTRFTSVCFTDTLRAVSNFFSIDSSTGAISTVSALNYETQQEYGVEVSVKDVSTSGSAILPPGQLTEFATVFISVIDVNEAPYWTS